MSLADKVTTGTYNHVFLIVKILLGLAFGLSKPAEDKTQYFVYLSFNSSFQLTNGISSDLQKLLKYFNGTAIVTLLKIQLFPSAIVSSNNLALYMKDLKLILLAISALILVTLSLE